mmetsp:Transcript_42056/g.110748  ORF Transcript_42056/g.110748 Transcript_42056/m.110748 type:complete len:230 (-) Transcript_42056:119-808(-)
MTWTILQCLSHNLELDLHPKGIVQLNCRHESLRTRPRRDITRFHRLGCQGLDCDNLPRTSSVRMRRVKVLWSCFLLLIQSQWYLRCPSQNSHCRAHSCWGRVCERKAQRFLSSISKARARMRWYILSSISTLPMCLRRAAGLSRDMQRKNTNPGGTHGSLLMIGDAYVCDQHPTVHVQLRTAESETELLPCTFGCVSERINTLHGLRATEGVLKSDGYKYSIAALAFTR